MKVDMKKIFGISGNAGCIFKLCAVMWSIQRGDVLLQNSSRVAITKWRWWGIDMMLLYVSKAPLIPMGNDL
jgi:hypothetical protein